MRFVETAAELLAPQDLAQISGLEFISGLASGRYPAPPICRTLNFWLENVEDGSVTFRGRPAFSAMNPIGTIHGGWFATLLDSCMSCAVQTRLPAGRSYTTLEFKVNILRPLLADSAEVLAIGRTVHVGRRTGMAEGRLVGADDGRVHATGSATCLILEL